MRQKVINVKEEQEKAKRLQQQKKLQDKLERDELNKAIKNDASSVDIDFAEILIIIICIAIALFLLTSCAIRVLKPTEELSKSDKTGSPAIEKTVEEPSKDKAPVKVEKQKEVTKIEVTDDEVKVTQEAKQPEPTPVQEEVVSDESVKSNVTVNTNVNVTGNANVTVNNTVNVN